MIRIQSPGRDPRAAPGHRLAHIPDPESLLREGGEALLEAQVRVRVASRERVVRYKGEVVGLLGPLGLLAYWFSKRSRNGRIRSDLDPQNDP